MLHFNNLKLPNHTVENIYDTSRVTLKGPHATFSMSRAMYSLLPACSATGSSQKSNVFAATTTVT